jgi:hypothetical protein
MSHPLDGARRKIERATDHVTTLGREIRAFLNETPSKHQIVFHIDTLEILPGLAAQPPTRLSLIAGDVLTNTRAALDYVLWELASRYFAPAVDLGNSGDRGILTFPVLLAGTKAQRSYEKRLKALTARGLPTKSIELMRAAQADVQPTESLRHLTRLVNTDKHQSLLITVGFIEAFGLSLESATSRREVTGRLHRGGIVLNTTEEMRRGLGDGSIALQTAAGVSVQWRDTALPGGPIDVTLAEIVAFVADLIIRFEEPCLWA